MFHAEPPVVVDRENEPYRWRCPNGHTTWDRTNSHIWCPSCSRAAENGADVTPEHWTLLDKQTDTEVDYADIEVEA